MVFHTQNGTICRPCALHRLYVTWHVVIFKIGPKFLFRSWLTLCLDVSSSGFWPSRSLVRGQFTVIIRHARKLVFTTHSAFNVRKSVREKSPRQRRPFLGCSSHPRLVQCNAHGIHSQKVFLIFSIVWYLIKYKIFSIIIHCESGFYTLSWTIWQGFFKCAKM